MISPVLAEFLGTSLLLGSISFTGIPALIIASFAIAVGLIGKISGAHINPAVTAWALLNGKIGKSKGMLYIIAQLSAAVFIWVMGSFVKV